MRWIVFAAILSAVAIAPKGDCRFCRGSTWSFLAAQRNWSGTWACVFCNGSGIGDQHAEDIRKEVEWNESRRKQERRRLLLAP